MNIKHILFVIALIFLAGFSRAELSEKFRQINQAYILDDSETAIKLCDEIIAENMNREDVLEAKFQKALIYEDKLVQYRDAMTLYEEYIKSGTNQRQINLARNNFNYLSALQARDELDYYTEFKKRESEYYRLIKVDKHNRKIKPLVIEIYKIAVHIPDDVSFKSKAIISALAVVNNENMYYKGLELLEILKTYDPQLYGEELFLKGRIELAIERFWIFVVTAVIDLLILLFIGYSIYKKKFVLAQPKHVVAAAMIFAVPLIVLGIYYFKYISRSPDGEFLADNIWYLVLEYALIIVFGLLYRGALPVITNKIIRGIARWSLGPVIGFTAWLVYAYFVDCMFLIKL